MKLVTSFTIDRATWARGGSGGERELLNADGNRCCLGFYLKACGISEGRMRYKALPSVMDGRVPNWLITNYGDEESAIAAINDDVDEIGLTEPEREAAVAGAFAGHGIKVKFVG